MNYFKFVSTSQLGLLILFTFLLLFSFTACIALGSFDISIISLFSGENSDLEARILSEIRIPRVLLAGMVGASLGLSGASLQGLFRNPLADPGLIGVSAGAALGAAAIIVFGAELVPDSVMDVFALPVSAILGASLVISILYWATLGFGHKGVTYMLLIGIAINALASVGIGLLTFLSTDSELRGLTFWMMGSFGNATWQLVLPATIIIILSFTWLLPSARQIDVLQLGEREALRLGIDAKKLKLKVITCSAVMVGASVSLSGMIGFVGLVVSHLVRLLGGVSHNFLLLGSALLGGTIMMTADLISRIIIQPAELPVGLITSALGSPFFLWLIIRSKRL
mgnify:CR=1 FL=1